MTTNLLVIFVIIAIPALVRNRPWAAPDVRFRRLFLTSWVNLACYVLATFLALLLAKWNASLVFAGASEIDLVRTIDSSLAAGGLAGGAVVAGLAGVGLLFLGWTFVLQPPGSAHGMRTDLDQLIALSNHRERVMIGVFDAVFVGAGEELLFRLGLPVLLFASLHSATFAFAASLVLFAIYHIGRNPWLPFYALIFGAYSTVLYLATGNIVLCIVIHAAANIFSSVVHPELVQSARLKVIRRAIRAQTQDSAAA